MASKQQVLNSGTAEVFEIEVFDNPDEAILAANGYLDQAVHPDDMSLSNNEQTQALMASIASALIAQAMQAERAWERDEMERIAKANK